MPTYLAHPSFAYLTLRIDNDSEGYRLTLLYKDARDGRSVVPKTFLSGELIRLDTELLLAARNDGPDEYGRLLARALFATSQARAALRSAFDQSADRLLMVLIELPPPDKARQVHEICWELLDKHLFTDLSERGEGGAPPDRSGPRRQIASRLVSSARTIPDYTLQRPPRALVLVAGPRDHGGRDYPQFHLIDIGAQVRLARSALPGWEIDWLFNRSFATDGRQELPRTRGTASRDALHGAVAATQYDLLLIVCHGAPDDTGAVALLLEDQHGNTARLRDDELVELIRAGYPPRLGVLLSCATADSSAGRASPLASVGYRLVQEAGVAAVVAMQDRISTQTAEQIVTPLFRQLDDGMIARSLAEARYTAAFQRHNVDWWSPTLYCALEDAQLWPPAGQGASKLLDRRVEELWDAGSYDDNQDERRQIVQWLSRIAGIEQLAQQARGLDELFDRVRDLLEDQQLPDYDNLLEASKALEIFFRRRDSHSLMRALHKLRGQGTLTDDRIRETYSWVHPNPEARQTGLDAEQHYGVIGAAVRALARLPRGGDKTHPTHPLLTFVEELLKRAPAERTAQLTALLDDLRKLLDDLRSRYRLKSATVQTAAWHDEARIWVSIELRPSPEHHLPERILPDSRDEEREWFYLEAHFQIGDEKPQRLSPLKANGELDREWSGERLLSVKTARPLVDRFVANAYKIASVRKLDTIQIELYLPPCLWLYPISRWETSGGKRISRSLADFYPLIIRPLWEGTLEYHIQSVVTKKWQRLRSQQSLAASQIDLREPTECMQDLDHYCNCLFDEDSRFGLILDAPADDAMTFEIVGAAADAGVPAVLYAMEGVDLESYRAALREMLNLTGDELPRELPAHNLVDLPLRLYKRRKGATREVGQRIGLIWVDPQRSRMDDRY